MNSRNQSWNQFGMIIGRFHPFHLEHLRYFHRAWKGSDAVIVGITNPDPSAIVEEPLSDHRHRHIDNPFTYIERVMMIQEGLWHEGFDMRRVYFTPFPLHHASLWRYYVPEHTTIHVVVYTPWEQSKADRLRTAGMNVIVHNSLTKGISGQQVRGLLATDGDWASLVPRGVASFLHRHRRGAR